MDKELVEDKLYQIIDLFNERKITSTKFYSKENKNSKVARAKTEE